MHMKIELKLIPNHFLALAGALDYLLKVQGNSRDQKIVKSAMNGLTISIHKKRVQVNSVSDLFNQKKKIKVTLEFFEASYLEIYLGMIMENPGTFELNDYNRNALLLIVNELNQKLA